MKNKYIATKYVVGDVVCTKVDPNIKLVIRRQFDRIYYCKEIDQPDRQEQAFFEKELL